MAHQYKITKPCHKTWDELIPQGQGRYCGSCEKVVMDLDATNAPKPGDVNFTGCGKLTTYENKVSIQKLNFFQNSLIKWLGVLGLFLIPSKKIKAQQNTIDNSPEVDKVNKRLYNVKKVVGQLREVDRSIPKGKIVMKDDTGIISEAKILANGRFILSIDTNKIVGDSVSITSLDDSLHVNLDTALISNYPKDSLFINVYPITVIVTCGATPYYGYEWGGVVINVPEISIPWKEPEPAKERDEKKINENVDLISIPKPYIPSENPNKEEENSAPEIVAVLNDEKKRKIQKNKPGL
jgi:hypothetical protein